MRAFVVTMGRAGPPDWRNSPRVIFRRIAANFAKKSHPAQNSTKSLNIGTGSSIWTFPLRVKFQIIGFVSRKYGANHDQFAGALGAMLAWTPSLIILAASLWDVRELDGME